MSNYWITTTTVGNIELRYFITKKKKHESI